MPRIILDDEDGTLAMLSGSVAQAAARIDGAAALRARRAAGADLDAALWAEMAGAGWLGLAAPEDMGGLGLGRDALAILFEGFGRSLLTEPAAELGVFPLALLAGCDGPGAAELGEGIAGGARIAPVLWRSPQGGPADLSAERRGGTLSLTGRAGLVAGAASATDFLALVRLDGETALLRLPAGLEGAGLDARPSVDGAALGRIDLTGCTAPEDAVLASGPALEAALEQAVELTRLAIAAELTGIACDALERTVAYTKGRVQFGKPIAAFQAIQHRLVDMWSDCELACAAVANAVRLAQEAPGAPAAQAVLAAKARASDAAQSVTRRAVHLHGAMGFTDECDIGLHLKRAVALSSTFGQAGALRLEFLARDRAA